jgi:hypothetical protein
MPRIGHAIAVGLALGVRLEWEPSKADWPGMDHDLTECPPAPESWWGGESGRGWLGSSTDDELTPAYLATLLGVEVRWWRLSNGQFSLDRAPGVDPKTWAHFENGPSPQSRTTRKRRLLSSAPLVTATYTGRITGLRLVWLPSDAPWRLRPWAVTGPPGRVRISKPRTSTVRRRSK